MICRKGGCHVCSKESIGKRARSGQEKSAAVREAQGVPDPFGRAEHRVVRGAGLGRLCDGHGPAAAILERGLFRKSRRVRRRRRRREKDQDEGNPRVRQRRAAAGGIAVRHDLSAGFGNLCQFKGHAGRRRKSQHRQRSPGPESHPGRPRANHRAGLSGQAAGSIRDARPAEGGV